MAIGLSVFNRFPHNSDAYYKHNIGGISAIKFNLDIEEFNKAEPLVIAIDFFSYYANIFIIMSLDRELWIPSDEEVTALDPVVRSEMAAALLRGIDPGRQRPELFTQFCRLTVASTVEVVPIRTSDEGPEVWLGQRSEDDRWWPGKWALPGVVILPNDVCDAENSLEGPIARMFENELEGIRRVDALHQLPSQFRFDGRGHEVTTQFWTRVVTGDEPYEGQFFNVESLRETEPSGGVLEEGWLTIQRAIGDFRAQQSSQKILQRVFQRFKHLRDKHAG